ncbi:MAG: acetyl-CoA decarbonylase/synthase complex subunit gamma [Methanobacteriota archaeon]|nr:MAG: acetyl-CoA decarbonylase/synthase complex subunit gamma [Euryarchaeota archaeon]
MPTAIEIYKLLPKKNCGECGVPTCLAFSMLLANQKTELSKCPYVSEEAKKTLEESAAPPIRLVKIGVGENVVEVGDETELFRHEKAFFHPTAYGLIINDSLPEKEFLARLEEAEKTRFERVGQLLALNMVAVKNSSGDPQRFVDAVKLATKSSLALVLMSFDPKAMGEALKVCSNKKPLVYAANNENFDEMCLLAKEHGCPLVIHEASNLENLAELAKKARDKGLEDLVLDFGCKPLRETHDTLTIIRRLAIKKKFRPLGFPVLLVVENDEQTIEKAIVGTAKYASIILLDDISREFIVPLFTLRQNIYTDPRVPLQVKPELYPVGSPDENSPLLFTTNFSLTYFTVLADIEKSKVPVWLQVVDTEGLSVLTAFAAGKLTPDSVVAALEKTNAKNKVKRNEIIIPGAVTRMSGKLEEISGMKVVVGPRESSALPKFLKEYVAG